MARKEVFANVFEQITGWRFVMIFILLLIGATVLYYFNYLGKQVEEREKRYAQLYAAGIKFTVEQQTNSSCDYTYVQEMLEANETVPMLLVFDGVPSESGAQNIPELTDKKRKWNAKEKLDFLYAKVAEMGQEHAPIEFKIGNDTGYVYYSNSLIVKQLKYFPFVLMGTFLVLGGLAFLAYSSSRLAEQNRVWVGLAKETAHQLGTPITGLTGWVELLKSDPNFDISMATEMQKDIDRLTTITTRFSSIGSIPQMAPENLGDLLRQSLNYLQKRISTKVKIHYNSQLADNEEVEINKHLFEWVIENLCKNAVDAMSGVGDIWVNLNRIGPNRIAIDIADNGKGISKSQQRKIFQPGFSTKKRGWGLGLTLAKRIIENYHEGRLFVKESELGKGTTFRIILKG
ncbi:MAG: sensor histidine kinase [Spirosomataceae bacterium]